jgi:prepilin-type N-terminal cleavage/methylation domain-containing protein
MKNNLTRVRGHCGFTLIEILVAVTILVMIFTIVFGTFFYTVDNAEEQEARAAIYHRANYILSDISHTVSCAMIPFGGAPPEDEKERPVFLGQVNRFEGFEAASLKVFTTYPVYGVETFGHDIVQVNYEVIHSRNVESSEWIIDDDNPLILQCFADSLFFGQNDLEEKEPMWMLNVHSFAVEYSDGSNWVSEWAYEDDESLPRAVKVTVELADSDDSVRSFSTVASVHVNTLLEGASDRAAVDFAE